MSSENMEWPNEAIFEFLKLYATEPALWNTKTAEHKNQKDLYDAWYRIRTNLQDGNFPIVEIKKKRDTLMSTYRKLRSKVMESVASGCDTDQIFKPDWPFYNLMSTFLDDVYNPRRNKNADGNQEVTTEPQRRKRKLKKKKVDTTVEPATLAEPDQPVEKVRTEQEDDCAAFCTNLKVQMRGLKTEQKYICQKLISDAIFLARTSQLNLTSKIHTEVKQPALMRIDSITRASSSFQIELVPDSSSISNKRSQRNSSLQTPGYFCMDPLHGNYDEDLDETQDNDSDVDTKDGVAGGL